MIHHTTIVFSLMLLACGCTERSSNVQNAEFQLEQTYTSVAPEYLESALGGLCEFSGPTAIVRIACVNAGKSGTVGIVVRNGPELGPFVTNAGRPVREVRRCVADEFVVLNSPHGFLSTNTQQE